MSTWCARCLSAAQQAALFAHCFSVLIDEFSHDHQNTGNKYNADSRSSAKASPGSWRRRVPAQRPLRGCPGSLQGCPRLPPSCSARLSEPRPPALQPGRHPQREQGRGGGVFGPNSSSSGGKAVTACDSESLPHPKPSRVLNTPPSHTPLQHPFGRFSKVSKETEVGGLHG